MRCAWLNTRHQAGCWDIMHPDVFNKVKVKLCPANEDIVRAGLTGRAPATVIGREEEIDLSTNHNRVKVCRYRSMSTDMVHRLMHCVIVDTVLRPASRMKTLYGLGSRGLRSFFAIFAGRITAPSAAPFPLPPPPPPPPRCAKKSLTLPPPPPPLSRASPECFPSLTLRRLLLRPHETFHFIFWY